jgi:succinate-semialdehyde dehydrogenase/glutarate-semialdehyde dehydrogenase
MEFLKRVEDRVFLNGTFHLPSARRTLEINNPASGEKVTSVGSLAEEEVAEAIRQSQEAFLSWRATPPVKRSKVLSEAASILRQNLEEAARLITLENGKPLLEARAEAEYSADYFDWFAGEARRTYGDSIPSDMPNRRILVVREPIGVVGAITPWNFPMAMLARKAGAAFASGCTLVSKPAPETPLSALFLAEIFTKAGLPPSVFQVVMGDAQMIADSFFRSPVVRKITFTGSTPVGQMLMERSAASLKRLTLELGGNAPLVIFEDADLTQTVSAAAFGKYRNTGQACVSPNRFLVHRSIVDAFVDQFVSLSRDLRVGDGMDPSSHLGPLISMKAVEKVRRLVKDALSRGARQHLGPVPDEITSRFVSPIVLTGITDAMAIWHEEIFGPVTAIRTFTDENEALTLANDTPHGLAGYVFSGDLARCYRFAERMEAGIVGINDTRIVGVQAPFGGTKCSGFGKEGSRYGIDEYTNLKYISLTVGEHVG